MPCHRGVCVAAPLVTLAGMQTELSLSFPPLTPAGRPWPTSLLANASECDGAILASANLTLWPGDANLTLFDDGGRSLLVTEHSLQIGSWPGSGRTAVGVLLQDDAGETVWSSPCGEADATHVWSVPPWLSVLPPIVTLIAAVALRQVMVGLLLGIWLGATIVFGGNPIVGGLRTVDHYLVDAVGGGSHPLIIVFTFLLGGMIAVVQKSGGAAGLARIATRCTTKASHVLLAAVGLATVVSFDDYASILISGSALRPIAAAMRVHPLRLCWALHGTGVVAPSLNPLSSWMGVQLGYLLQQVSLLDGLAEQTSALSLLLATVPFRFFSVLYFAHVLLMLLLPWASDFGTMRAALAADAAAAAAAAAAEKNADADTDADAGALPPPSGEAVVSETTPTPVVPSQQQPQPQQRGDDEEAAGDAAGGAAAAAAAAAAAHPDAPDDDDAAAAAALSDAPPQALYAAVPFAALLVCTPLGMYLDGKAKAEAGAGLLGCFAKADSTAALTWATFLGCVLSLALPLSRCPRPGYPRQNLATLMGAWVDGVREVTDCTVILLLAWALGELVHDLKTAQFLAGALGSWLPVGMLPAAATLLAMLLSFGVGSAWGAMGILIPLVGPLVWELAPLETRLDVLTCAFGGVMGGCVFGNVSSPLGDTAVLSAMVSRCDMMEHVASQATYTALVAALALLLGALPVGLGVYPAWVALLLCVALLAAAPALARLPHPREWRRARTTRAGGDLVKPLSLNSPGPSEQLLG